MEGNEPSEFERAASEPAEASLFVELWDFMRDNKKWWLLPILLVLLVMAALVVLGNSALAPFIYPFF